MSNILGTYKRALRIFSGANANIPYPETITSGQNDGVASGELKDATKNFNSLGVKPGDIVYNTTTSSAATVIEVISNHAIKLNADIFLVTSNDYVLYQNSSQTTLGNRGCSLYIGVDDNVQVQTIGGDIVEFSGVKQGTILPVQITKLITAVNDTHIALW